MKILELVLPLHPKSHVASSGNRGSEKYKQTHTCRVRGSEKAARGGQGSLLRRKR